MCSAISVTLRIDGSHSQHLGDNIVARSPQHSEVCMRFIRFWDRPDKDPALSSKAMADFRNTVDILFVKGYILCDPEEPGDIDKVKPDSLGAIAGLVAKND